MPAADYPGVERIEARFFGAVYEPHRHDTYALGITLGGVQTFRYRGRTWDSMPGNVIVLYPDEVHDGGAGTEECLRYRMLYLAPSLLSACLGYLPFVEHAVLDDRRLHAIIASALRSLRSALDPLFVDGWLMALAEHLARHARQPAPSLSAPDLRQASAARDYLAAHAARTVTSEELEHVTGLDRFALTRQFRRVFATTPHRFLMMRRVQGARRMIETGMPLCDIAAAAGFADQSHLNRQFKKTYGMTPGRWAEFVKRGALNSPRTDGIR